MATPSLPCANCDPDGLGCQNAGKSGCANCRLVFYCSSECQKAHWPVHKGHCKSPMNSEDWKPEWVRQKRTPGFVADIEVPMSSSFGGDSWLWGGVPALDVLKLEANEGESYKGKLSLLFAASGDMRNVVKTIAQLPPGWDQPVDIVMNDIDLAVIARNAILLLIALTADHENEATDCIIHIWYSSLIRESDRAILEQRVRPLIQTVCDKIKDKPANRILGKTWTFGKRSLRLVLTKAAWDKFLSYTTVPEGLTVERANEIRKAVTLAESHFDFLERHYLFAIPSHRVPMHRFREDGILQPFGAQRSEFCIPNPTLFQAPFDWPIPGGSDPCDGWSPKDLEETDNGPATSDIDGKLFTHLRSMLKSFTSRIASTTISFQLLNIEATKLIDHLNEGSFDLSNISDSVHLGPHLTALAMLPLLRSLSGNPHATLITRFEVAIGNAMTKEDYRVGTRDERAQNETMAILSDYIPMRRPPTCTWDVEIIKWDHASELIRTYDHIYDRIAHDLEFHKFPEYLKVGIKDQSTIIEKWPFRLKLKFGQQGAQQEFDRVMGQAITAKAFYLEFKRV
ncbi:uncharacterized protein FTJAE_776 [Fusarium tjaetaba]|uniref:MYND-type domain-containing protein n=1 Tax=Fusarium tjaetaba TaxID=1567544 RepID=A0A8H5SDI4_9HYPO|nr:uncharacterized protein FTJAE_776 [Fusarium tjaetaba]KAF5649812.1 hypothetical protein FTJAE_776 [Fusarium tjaetaba]